MRALAIGGGARRAAFPASDVRRDRRSRARYRLAIGGGARRAAFPASDVRRDRRSRARYRLAILLVLVATPAYAQDKVYNGLTTTDLDDMSKVLRRHVAYLEITPKAEQGVIGPDRRSGYGAVIEKNLVVALGHLLQDTKRVVIVGPSGRLEGQVVLLDLERRVALIRTKRPLSKIGLLPVRVSPVGERKAFMDVFALVSTDETAGVLHTEMVNDGTDPAYEGHPRIDIKLQFGTPVFDNRARLIGYSRVVAWDQDRYMIVPAEKISLARTSTGGAARRKADEKSPPSASGK